MLELLDEDLHKDLFLNTNYPRTRFWIGGFFYLILGVTLPLLGINPFFYTLITTFLGWHFIVITISLWILFCIFKMIPYLMDAIKGEHIIQTSLITKKIMSDNSYYIYTKDNINAPLNFLPVKKSLYEEAKSGNKLAVLKTKYTHHILDQNILPK